MEGTPYSVLHVYSYIADSVVQCLLAYGCILPFFPLLLHPACVCVQFVMDTMTQILAQTVYGLDLKDLPLQRLLKEESMIGRRNRTPSLATTDLSASPLTAFSDVEGNTNISTLRLAGVNRSAEERRSRGMMSKSRTVDIPQPPESSPPGRARRYMSIPAEGKESYLSSPQRDSSVPSGLASGSQKKERSVSDVEGISGEHIEVPIRSSSSEGHYRTIAEEEEEEGDSVSPAESLPATITCGMSADVTANHSSNRLLQRSERVEDEVDTGARRHDRTDSQGSLTITNLHTPTPEPELLQSPGVQFERGGSVEPLLETAEKPLRTKRSLFGRSRNKSESSGGGGGRGRGGGGEGRSRRKSSSALLMERDLVFANESLEESATLLDDDRRAADEREGVQIPPVSLVSHPTTSWTGGDRTCEERQKGVSDTDGVTEGPGEGKRGAMRVYKSSSEGNIRQLMVEGEGEGGGGEGEDSQSTLGTPIATSSSYRSKKKRSVDFTAQDEFSSSIIPSSPAKYFGSPVGPRSQSPVIPTLSPVHDHTHMSPRSTPTSQLALRRGAGRGNTNCSCAQQGRCM